MKQKSKPLFFAVSFIVFGLLISIHSYVSWTREGLSVTWQHVAALEGTRWGLWILVSFFVLKLLQNLPITRENWKSRLVLYMAIGVVICLLHFAADTKMHLLVQPWPLPEPFHQLFIERLGSIRIVLSFVVYGAILGIALAADYYRKYQDGELRSVHLEKQLAQAQLQALKMQLHPHFLFNTLNSIAALVRNNRNKEATDMLAGLSDLLRLVLESDGAQEISLKQELEFLQKYLEIERIRFQDRLVVNMKIAPETLQARVPNLILQPLVENAIQHGIALNPDAGTIEISAQKCNSQLDLSIINSSPDSPAEQFDKTEGTGLSNTRSRLEKLYGQDQELKITHDQKKGTSVTLSIPF